jgi:phage tail-like protein
MIDYYPPSGFYYSVAFSISPNRHDLHFQSVSGLSVEYEMEPYKEGGENRFIHQLPGRTKYPNLVLKRGLILDSVVTQWCMAAFTLRKFIPADVVVILMNDKGLPMRTWNVAHAIPVKWMIADLNAEKSEILVETLELSYRYFVMI